MKPADIVARLKYMLNLKTGRLLDREGNQYWYFHWQEHRDGGLPAYEGKNGTKRYYKFGEPHREGDLPAVEWADGSVEYYKNGLRHRDGGLPAIVMTNGDRDWYVNGKLDREDGPARERANGKNEYWRKGEMWETGKQATQVVKEEKRVKEEFVQAAKETETVETHIQALKDAKNKKPPPSLKP